MSANDEAQEKSNVVTEKVEEKDLTDDIPMTFPQRLMEILSSELHSDIITWLPHGKAFIIYKKKKFAADVLPRYFKQSKFTSFTRKLNRWGFTRVTRGPETGSYFHKFFVREDPRLCMQMSCQNVRLQSELEQPMHHTQQPILPTMNVLSIMQMQQLQLQELQKQQQLQTAELLRRSMMPVPQLQTQLHHAAPSAAAAAALSLPPMPAIALPQLPTPPTPQPPTTALTATPTPSTAATTATTIPQSLACHTIAPTTAAPTSIGAAPISDMKPEESLYLQMLAQSKAAAAAAAAANPPMPAIMLALQNSLTQSPPEPEPTGQVRRASRAA